MKEDIASSQLQAEQGKLLDKIDELRTIGVGGIVELPQLIVCGSQSSGKSSVLEAISRVRFPAKDNVCTRFATEVVLRRTPTTTNKVSIKPGPSRHNEQELRRLRGFQHGEFHDGEDLPAIIEKAKECMGIDDSAHTGFSDDVLLVEISGPDKPELTLVDLPGLYSSTSQDQGQEGITIVRDLTEKYMQNSRSIILAVISAKADYHLQEILDIAKKFDSSLERTLGVITHPDTLEERSGLEDNYLRFIQNEKVRLKLGWHVLRNRSHGTRDATDKDRDELEKDFFNKGRWASIPRDRVGIDSLRHRLSKILLNHIRRHLPEMVTEIKEKIAERQQSRLKLGDARSTIQEQRGYLLGISSDFNKITKDALDGMYKNSFFVSLDSAGGDSIDSSRLRAVIRESNEQFLDAMAVGGFSRIIIDYEHQKMTGAAYNTATSNEYLQDWSEVYVTRKNLEIEVADHARRNRGTELPGNPNQGEVGYWFREQSQPWEELARKHLMAAWGAVDYFVSLVLDHLTDEHTYPLICGLVLEPELERMKDNVLKKLEELIYQFKRGHPLPVGKNFLKRVQQARISRDSAKLHQELNAAGGRENHESGIDPTHITKVFSNIQSSRDEFAAADIIDQMEAYYNDASLIFINNVATLGIENCLLDPLNEIFTGQTINNMSDSEIEKLAAEPDFVQGERERLSREIDQLENGRRILNSFGGAGRGHPVRPAASDKHGSNSASSSGGQNVFQPPVNGSPSGTGGSRVPIKLFGPQKDTPVKSNEKPSPSTFFSRPNNSTNPSGTNGTFSFGNPVGTSGSVPFFGNNIYPPPSRTSTMNSEL